MTRKFCYFGPVEPVFHYAVDRSVLIENCYRQLIGQTQGSTEGVMIEKGHYYTVWAPRQSGKTWVMRQVQQRIEKEHADRFIVGEFSMQALSLKDTDPEDKFLESAPYLFRDAFGIKINVPRNWSEWRDLFHKDVGVFDRKAILILDEFDCLPVPVRNHLVALFRDMYLHADNYMLHGLALIGVRSVLGIGGAGSPFNVQKSQKIPNLTREEVDELFRQYCEENNRPVQPAVLDRLYENTRGQPGLVNWFGYLLTEKYELEPGRALDRRHWNYVYSLALSEEPNNTIINLLGKARGEHLPWVLKLFSKSDIPFSLDAEWCNYLHLNGVIDSVRVDADAREQPEEEGAVESYCRFSNPFVQRRLFNALVRDYQNMDATILLLDPLDDLADVFESDRAPNLPALLARYSKYLTRLKERGQEPWKGKPVRETDMHPTEAVGHFHLFGWLTQVLEDCTVSPEFPTGNGKVDIHVRCGGREAIIEIKVFQNMKKTAKAREQAAGYARQLKLERVTLALFVPVIDEVVLQKLSGTTVIDGVTAHTVAISFGV